ncbi:hypothetical protein [Rodentibacter haemolyticus]|uniref:Uncharacterized protein n=1 Tax=Rodentibacter haemolyticus TaxID=2778911 RepID=A0ABX6UXT8_9PAST|nr:hypothetical protein [Rodentibacter haemolyticus]QPB42667.1 hypothetical protein IHV77_00630 [Rodentibacter haemolyticus]
MTETTAPENDYQEKPTLQQAREYLNKLIDIAGKMKDGKLLKENITQDEIWQIFHQHLGNVERLIEIAQEQLREI